ncbi:zinc-binding protein A33-like [Engraulis encrasicolus]|uniref:zinc-binding protein A33-like n=1 Tax=Engraulis encrasicolus TaxID=184585 RepID=UPI002FCF8F5B
MASSLEKDLTCPVCSDIFKDPVVLSCSHSVCNICVQHYWESKGSMQCPVCKNKSSEAPTSSYALKNLCELYLKEKGNAHGHGRCKEHKKHLKLFCHNDQELLCQLCEDSKAHKGHKCSSISKAVTDFKEELMVKLQKKMKDYEKARDDCHRTIMHIKTQSKQTEKHIKKIFSDLHQYLRDEEKARIAALKEDEKLKSQLMKKQVDKITSLPESIKAIREEMAADDITFLQNYRSTVERAQCSLKDPEKLSGALINVATHLGNLKFKVWEKMQEIVQYSPVTLDPNTAHTGLMLSEDLTNVKRSDEKQQLPDNPERFDRYFTVVGSEGFDSGTHCWDVEVGENSCWGVGVMTESVQRKGECATKNGQWYFWYKDGKYWACATPHPSFLLAVRQKPQRIRVQLNWDRQELVFSDPDSNTHLHTLEDTFSERVFPYLNTGEFPLKILPVKVSIAATQQLS